MRLTRRTKRIVLLSLSGGIALVGVWLVVTVIEWRAGIRLFPWSAYADCGSSVPAQLPLTVKIGLYEEFPVAWRLDKLKPVDFPVTLALAAATRAEFEQLRENTMALYPQVQDVYFWPLLTMSEGYYPGSWSDAEAVERVAQEADGVPVLWDLEVPRDQILPNFVNWWRNTRFLDQWFRQRTEPVAIWRSHRSMGLDAPFLRLVGMHYDPLDYPAVSLHLDLYMTGTGIPDNQLAQILRCGVERYGERFVPSLGVLNDGEGDPSIFIPPETFRRFLMQVRNAGVSEVWLFGVNGLNEEYLKILREMLPLETLDRAA